MLHTTRTSAILIALFFTSQAASADPKDPPARPEDGKYKFEWPGLPKSEGLGATGQVTVWPTDGNKVRIVTPPEFPPDAKWPRTSTFDIGEKTERNFTIPT